MSFLNCFWALLLILTAIIDGPFAAPAPERSSWLPKIIGGDPSFLGEFPFIVSIQRAIRDGDPFSPICGGAIISPTVVVTAAHCATVEAAYQVVAGEFSFSAEEGTEQVRMVEMVVNHRQHEELHLLHDIALHFLEEPLEFNEYVKPIRLPFESNLNLSGSGVVAGWGVTENGGAGSEILNKLKVPLHSDSVCEDIYGGAFKPQGMLCAGSLEGGKDHCAGDSGGPLIISGEDREPLLAGVVSWGPGNECAEPGLPGVYTKVSAYIGWIEYIIQQCTPKCPIMED